MTRSGATALSLLLAAASLTPGCRAASSTATPTGSSEASSGPAAFTEAQVKAELAKYVCAAKLDEAPEVYTVLFGSVDCIDAPGQPEPRGALAEVARATALEMTAIARLSTHAISTAYAYIEEAPRTRDDARRKVQEIWWSDPLLGPTALRRASMLLAERGASCTDCAPVSAAASRVLPWSAFVPYVAAYVWPVAPSPDERVMAVYVCGGINGAARTDGDLDALHAGFLVAMGFVEDEDAQHRLAGVIERTRARNPTVDEMRYAIDGFLNADETLASACTTLARFAWLTGIHVSDCSSPRPS